MALQVNDVVTRARSTLLDASGVAWTDAELISYFNGGLSQIIALKPDAYPVRSSVTLVSGVAQPLPTGGILFMGANYNDTGASVTVQPFDEFIRVHPTWFTDPAGSVRYVLFDPRTPRLFYVYPKATAGDALNIIYGGSPPRVTALNDGIGLLDYWENALWAFVCALAYAKNSKRQDFAKSDEMMKLFMQTVGGVAASFAALGAKPDIRGVT